MGMLARVNITLQVKDDVLKIPVTSLRDLNERTFVETVVNEQRRSLPVVTGIRSDSEVEVLSGLDEGPDDLLRTLDRRPGACNAFPRDSSAASHYSLRGEATVQ